MMSRMRIHIADKLHNKSGETLLELVMSLGLFSVTMLTVATMFLGAMKMARANYDADQNFDRMMTAIVRDENTAKAADRTLEFHIEGGGSASQKVELRKTALEGAADLYRFRAE